MHYKYTYFNLRGRGETCRMVLLAGGFDWEDNRFTGEQLAEVKPRCPFGQVPIIEFDGHVVGQSNAISRYLGREAGLCGVNSLENLQIDAVYDQVTDALDKYLNEIFHGPKDQEEKNQIEYINEYLPNYFPKLERAFQSNNAKSGFFVGNKMSIADLHFYATFNGLKLIYAGKGLPELSLSGYPGLQSCYDKVASDPKIKAYVDKRPESDI